ncbi:MAG: hypothetical protein Q9160_004947, partial [Pyrenula sp. 1 TL-2023]
MLSKTFLDLPPEIRIRIYHLVLKQELGLIGHDVSWVRADKIYGKEWVYCPSRRALLKQSADSESRLNELQIRPGKEVSEDENSTSGLIGFGACCARLGRQGAISFALLLTNKHIYLEASDILYRLISFTLAYDVEKIFSGESHESFGFHHPSFPFHLIQYMRLYLKRLSMLEPLHTTRLTDLIWLSTFRLPSVRLLGFNLEFDEADLKTPLPSFQGLECALRLLATLQAKLLHSRPTTLTASLNVGCRDRIRPYVLHLVDSSGTIIEHHLRHQAANLHLLLLHVFWPTEEYETIEISETASGGTQVRRKSKETEEQAGQRSEG